MYKNFAKNILTFLVRFSPVLLIVGPLFFTKGYLFFTDFVWGPHIMLDWTSSSFLLELATKGLSFALPVDLIEKFYITFCLGLALWGGRKIAGLFLKEQWLVFVASLFVLFNPFVYDRVMYGQCGIVAAFGLMLLGIGFLFEYLEKKQTRQILFAGICFAFSIQFSAHFLFFIAAFYVFIFLPMFCCCHPRGGEDPRFENKKLVSAKVKDWKRGLSAFADNDKRDGKDDRGVIKNATPVWRKMATEIVKVSIVFAIIAFVLNANWIVASVTGKSGIVNFVGNDITTQDLVAFQTSGKTGLDALGNVLMMSGFWGKDQFRYADLTTFVNNWGRSFFILLPLVLWGFVVGLRSKEKKYKYLTIGSAILFIFSAVLATGIRIPVGRELTYFLFDHLPFYKGLRESQKWVSVVATIYLIFLSLGLRELFSKKIVARNAVAVKFFVGAVIVMQAPLLLFGFGGQITPTQYPGDWYAANNYIVHDSGCAGNTLFFPWHMYMSFNWLGSIVANPAVSFFECPVVSGTDMEWGGIYDNSQSPEGQAVDAWLNSGGATDLLRNSAFNIRYVILAKELDWENYVGIGTNHEFQLVMETPTLRVYKVTQP